jgi:hypothetical protein
MLFRDIPMVLCLLAFLISLVGFKKRPLHLRFFSLFLLFTFLVDLGAWYIYKYERLSNQWLYNIAHVPVFEFFAWFFLQVIRSENIKKLIRIFMYFFPVLAIGNILFGQGFYTFNTYTYIAGGVSAVSMAIAYFTQLLNPTEYFDISKDPVFWICTGIIFFYVGDIPYSGMINYLWYNHNTIAVNYRKILTILNILMFLLFSMAFLCRSSPQK